MSARAFGLFDELLRSPKQSADRAMLGRELEPLVLAALAAIVVGSGLFGGVLATSRGGVQLLYSAAKVPLALVATLVLVVPAFYAIAASLGRPLALRSAVGLVLAGAARAALVLVALTPLVWLCLDGGASYHQGVILASACYGLSGLAALRLILHGLGADLRGFLVLSCFAAVMAPVGAQTAWMLRPFFGRPADVNVPFFRPRESSFLDAVARSARSSVGIYDRGRLREGCERPADCAPRHELENGL
ncbi:MAG TPA: hypothetical protein VFZ53_28085 [Polyangiaceae bacterium]